MLENNVKLLKIINYCKYKRGNPGGGSHKGKNTAAQFGRGHSFWILIRFERNKDVKHGDGSNQEE